MYKNFLTTRSVVSRSIWCAKTHPNGKNKMFIFTLSESCHSLEKDDVLCHFPQLNWEIYWNFSWKTIQKNQKNSLIKNKLSKLPKPLDHPFHIHFISFFHKKSKWKINQTRKTKTQFSASEINIVTEHFISRDISTETLKSWVKSILYLFLILNPNSRKTAFTLMFCFHSISFCFWTMKH